MLLLLWCSLKCRLALQENERAPLLQMSGNRELSSHWAFILYSREWQDLSRIHSAIMHSNLLCHASCTVKDFSPANTLSGSSQRSQEMPPGTPGPCRRA